MSKETLPLDGLYESLQKLEGDGYGVFVGLYAIAQGMRLNAMIGL